MKKVILVSTLTGIFISFFSILNLFLDKWNVVSIYSSKVLIFIEFLYLIIVVFLNFIPFFKKNEDYFCIFNKNILLKSLSFSGLVSIIAATTNLIIYLLGEILLFGLESLLESLSWTGLFFAVKTIFIYIIIFLTCFIFKIHEVKENKV